MEHYVRDIAFLVGGTALGVIAGTWHSYFHKRPILDSTGGGSGGVLSNKFSVTYIRVHNRPGLMGLKIRESIVFGMSLHGRIEIGVPFDRSPARGCRGLLFVEGTDEIIFPLWWRKSDGSMVTDLTLGPDEWADLIVFGKETNDHQRYFAYRRANGDDETVIPPDHAKFIGSKKFIVEIRHSNDRVKIRIPASVTATHDGRLYYRIGDSGGSF
jgi:hypothetical protein